MEKVKYYKVPVYRLSIEEIGLNEIELYLVDNIIIKEEEKKYSDIENNFENFIILENNKNEFDIPENYDEYLFLNKADLIEINEIKEININYNQEKFNKYLKKTIKNYQKIKKKKELL